LNIIDAHVYRHSYVPTKVMPLLNVRRSIVQ
jgi:hypothetical protein